MAASAPQFQWHSDGSVTITVNGHTVHVSAAANLQPGSAIYVGGKQVTVPAKPVQPAPVLPYLTPEQQMSVNESIGHFDEILSTAGLGVKQADIQLNQIDLPQINLRAAQQGEATVESMAGRGLSNSGIRDSDLIDVERSRTMNETQARARFTAAQDAYDAAQANVNSATTKLNDWITNTSGENARRDNSDIAPVEGANVALQPYKGPTAPGAGAPANAAPAGPKPTYALPSISTTPNRPGEAVPATNNSYASGPPPGPDYVWTGNRWVKMGTAQNGAHGLGPSGPPPGPNYYWNGVKWVKTAAATGTGGAKLPKVKKR